MEVRVQSCIFPDVWASPNVKHEVLIIMNVYVDQRRGRVFTPIPEGWEGPFSEFMMTYKEFKDLKNAWLVKSMTFN